MRININNFDGPTSEKAMEHESSNISDAILTEIFDGKISWFGNER